MKKNKIFLLEDNPIHSQVICDGLEDAGFNVKKAQNITAAEKILQEFTPDLFLLDIVIETIKSGGIQFAQKMRNNPKFQSIPVLFISAHLDDLNIEKYFPPGSNENILPKPFDFDYLIKKIKEVLKN
jgi:two-component system phosphate regulon response regulator PhoB